MNKLILALIAVIGCVDASMAQIDTFKLMQYNLLMFPEGNPTKATHFQTILNFYNPDIISLNELTSSVAIDSINSVVDTTKYSFGPFYPDEIISNALMYNKQKLGLASSFAFQTSPRKTHIYKLYSKNQDFFAYPDTVFMNIGVVHFKSSQGGSNQNIRLIQATDITDYIRVFEPDNFILAGDYNMYTSEEPAYQELISPAVDYLVDPINRPGSWNNNASFADIHTQSPRTTSFDGGVTGGLDDRFDIVLVLNEIMEGTGGIRYLPGTYQVPGNDGNHFNTSILANPLNTSAPQEIIEALHAMSDHLPVIMDVEMDPSNVSTYSKDVSPFGGCCPKPAELFSDENSEAMAIYDFSGKLIEISTSLKLDDLQFNPGFYVMKLSNSSCNCSYKMMIRADAEILFSR
jgi:endonuclease/exonuclease/phosphatase family metal-dependent hydrolase